MIRAITLFLAAFVLVACETQNNIPATEPPIPTTVLPANTAPATATPTLTPRPTETPTPQATATPTPTATPSATSPPPELPAESIQLEEIATGFARPTYLTHAQDERLFITEQAGSIWIVDQGEVLSEPFLDIGSLVGSSALEQGLLSVAFHPRYQENGRFFVNYTDLAGDTVVAEYKVSSSDPNKADAESERILLRVDQPYVNHNGGQLQFGPDGMLYIGMGDGGSANDPSNNGQNKETLLGAVLRIDVDSGEPYGIPGDNPFIGSIEGRDEIWAMGVRNPWRFSFDRETNDLYLADVGQNMWEEVNFVRADTPGGLDYGWRIMEGNHCFMGSSCDIQGRVLPIAEYSHQEGCSITGGYVYRGELYQTLRGNYFFADYCRGTIWALFRLQDGAWQKTIVNGSGLVISSFGEDYLGELYVLDHNGGAIYRITS